MTAATKAAPAPGRGRRTTTARLAGGKRTSSGLSDQVLALATGKTQQEIAGACRGARPIMSAPRLPGTSGLAASRSATGSSTPPSRRERRNARRYDARLRRPSVRAVRQGCADARLNPAVAKLRSHLTLPGSIAPDPVDACCGLFAELKASSLAEASAVPSSYVFATRECIWRHWISWPPHCPPSARCRSRRSGRLAAFRYSPFFVFP